jgi:hypothetical protein
MEDKDKQMPGFVQKVDCCRSCAHSHTIDSGYEMPEGTYCLHNEEQKVIDLVKGIKDMEHWPWHHEDYEWVSDIRFHLSVRDTGKCDLFKREE